MIPVVMLVINTGALSCLVMTCPSFEQIPVIYLAVIVLAAIGAIWEDKGRVVFDSISSDSDIQLVYLSFSLLINISATSIIAHKAWCVHVHNVFGIILVD